MARKPAEPNKQLSRRVLVLITRDVTEKTPRVIWQHEYPILEAIFGEGNVAAVATSALDEGYSNKVRPDLLPYNKVQDHILPPSETASIGHVFVGDPRGEYERLALAYGRHVDVNETMVEHIYGRFQSGKFAEMLGTPEVEDLPESQLRALAVSYGYIPATSKDSSQPEKEEARSKELALRTMPHEELVKLADALGVSFA